MKARFQSQQAPVKTVQSGDFTYVFICLNEKQGTEEYPDDYEESNTQNYYEYDYNEFSGKTDLLLLDDIKLHPENYLDYVYKEDTKDEAGELALKKIAELEAAIERGLAL